jgi:hypothetical protein
MTNAAAPSTPPTAPERERMHEVYRRGGEDRQMAPHIVYPEAGCPHGCGHHLQAIDFRLEDHGRGVHDPLVRAWWADTGFVGRCPGCRGWVHFTIREKRAVSDEEAAGYPRLPDDWHARATIL